MSKKDGGPAFPVWTEDMPVEGSPGMTLRDYAAIHAHMDNVTFSGLGAAAEFLGEPTPDGFTAEGDLIAFSARVTARLRYLFADAMIGERNR